MNLVLLVRKKSKQNRGQYQHITFFKEDQFQR